MGTPGRMRPASWFSRQAPAAGVRHPHYWANGAGRNSKIDFPVARASHRPVQDRGGRCFGRPKRNRRIGRPESFLRGQLLGTTRAAPPFIQHERRERDSFDICDRPAKRRSRAARTSQRVDQDGRVEQNHFADDPGVRRPLLFLARRTSSISASAVLNGCGGIRSMTSSNTMRRRRRSCSLSRPARAAYSATASRTTALVGIPSRSAVRSICVTVSRSSVTVIFTVAAILVPYRHTFDAAVAAEVSVRQRRQGCGVRHRLAAFPRDPDGNGLELYCDLPFDEWPRRNGQVVCATGTTTPTNR